jgi:hypothetical protein
MIFSRMWAGVVQSIRRSTRKPRLNHEANRWLNLARDGTIALVRMREDLFLLRDAARKADKPDAGPGWSSRSGAAPGSRG